MQKPLEDTYDIARGGLLYGIEVKAVATPTPRHADGLATWLRMAAPNARGVLAYRVEQPQTQRPEIRVVPWHLPGRRMACL